tara:strand:+ start:1254 stop:1493 length:240 start_codon:yes stop_codon:yes gene_type:complete
MENVKLILLRERSEVLIGSVTELDEEPSLLIEKCMEVREDGALKPFPLYAAQRDLFLTSEVILTIVDPSEKILEAYKAA